MSNRIVGLVMIVLGVAMAINFGLQFNELSQTISQLETNLLIQSASQERLKAGVFCLLGVAVAVLGWIRFRKGRPAARR